MFGNAYFGASYFGPTYFGPDGEPSSGGTTKDWRYKITKEHLKELEQFGLVRDGIVLEEDVPKVEEVLEVSLEEYSLSLSDLSYLDEPGLADITQEIEEITILSEEVSEPIEDDVDEDIRLILMIIELHGG